MELGKWVFQHVLGKAFPAEMTGDLVVYAIQNKIRPFSTTIKLHISHEIFHSYRGCGAFPEAGH
jgi:hypothetical protein